MGQISLPVLNRTGYSMFWSSTWENTHNFQQQFKEDYLLKLLIQFFFTKSIFNAHFFFKKTSFLEYGAFYNAGWISNTVFQNLDTEFLKTVLRSKTVPTYFSKVWIMRFNSWLIVFVIFFKPLENMLDFKSLKTQLKIKTSYNDKIEFNKTVKKTLPAHLLFFYLCIQQKILFTSFLKTNTFKKTEF